jgi:hypothetical protein
MFVQNEEEETVKSSLLNDNSNNINFDKNFIKKDIDNENLIFKKKKLIDICKNLTKLEYLEIFNIIQEDNCQFSENKNGIFINLQNVNEKTIYKIFYFLDFIKLKKEDLVKQEEYLNDARKNMEIEIPEKNENIILKKNNVNEEYELSEEDDEDKISNFLVFSSDEDDDLENKISLKKKKTKYSGKKLKMIKSIKDNDNFNKIKQKNKKLDSDKQDNNDNEFDE